jgi:hypothetical protein
VANYQPEEFVGQIQRWARMKPLEHHKLLTKGQIFEKETVARVKNAEQRSKAESKKAKHHGDL